MVAHFVLAKIVNVNTQLIRYPRNLLCRQAHIARSFKAVNELKLSQADHEFVKGDDGAHASHGKQWQCHSQSGRKQQRGEGSCDDSPSCTRRVPRELRADPGLTDHRGDCVRYNQEPERIFLLLM